MAASVGGIDTAKVHEASVGEDVGRGDPGVPVGVVETVEAGEVAEVAAESHGVKVFVESVDEQRDGMGGLGDELADVLRELGMTLNSIEDDALGESLQVVWELEPGARISEKVDLPEPTGFDLPRRLDAFLGLGHRLKEGSF